jgi:hypothetical protein
MPKEKIELASLESRWKMDDEEDYELFRVITKEEPGKSSEEEPKEDEL